MLRSSWRVTTRLFILWGLVANSALATTLTADQNYLGFTQDGIRTFLGVPYASAARWEMPALRPKLSHPQQQNADTFGPACAQTPHIVDWYVGVIKDFGGDPNTFPHPNTSEGCLNLNIWAPEQIDKPLPVLVYIHGGSNKGGWSYEPNYIGHNLAKQDIIVVTINYRLGVLGFFAHPDIPDPNFALMDQVTALQWIHQYAGQLGADLNNITIMGESAGANNVDFLMVTPHAQGLFHKAIHQSAGWSITGRVDLQSFTELGISLLSALPEKSRTINELRRLPVQELLNLSQPIYANHFFDPVPGTPSLPTAALAAFESRQFHSADLLIGSNADEWLMYVSDDATLDTTLHELVPQKHHSAVRTLLSGLSEAEALDTLITAHNYVCPSFRLAAYNQTAGQRAWFYYFSRVREGELAQAMGAYHGAELPYVFNTHDEWLPTNRTDEQLSEQIMSYWVNFIRAGNPNGANLPAWPQFDDQYSTAILDIPYRSATHPSAKLCKLLELQ